MGEKKAGAPLEAFKLLQEFYIMTQGIDGVDKIGEHLSGLVEPFDLDVEAILSVAGCRVGHSEALASCIATVAPSKMKEQINAGVDRAEPGSALWGFGAVRRHAAGDHEDGDEGDESASATAGTYETILSKALASNDVAETGRLLISVDVKELRIQAGNVPAKLLRRPSFGCSVLDVAVGSGAVEVAKCLLEFHEVRPTRETLKMALSSGSFELVRICWGRLPETEQKRRLDLLEVAGDFHQLEILAWLFRDADKFESELFIDVAIRRHLADALLAILVDGFNPWWAVEAAAKWAPTREIVFGPAPEGFWPDGGWFTKANGETNGIGSVTGRWTRVLTESELGQASDVTTVVLPRGVTAISCDAFSGYTALQSLTIQPGCLAIEDEHISADPTRSYRGAMLGCSSLVTVRIPGTCTGIGPHAFAGCSGLNHVVIPSSVVSIGAGAFSGCTALTEVTIPGGVTSIGTMGRGAFSDCSALRSIDGRRASAALGAFFFSGCSELRSVCLPSECTGIGDWAFNECSSLASITIPHGCTTVGAWAFNRCVRLSRISVPGSCMRVGEGAFFGCKQLVSILLPGAGTSVGPDAFCGCSALASVGFSAGHARSIGHAAFRGCTSLSEIDVPFGCRSIDHSAFRGCASLSRVSIPVDCGPIARDAFAECSSLSDVSIPTGCASIGDSAFSACSSLSEVVLPASCASIGGWAFCHCATLSSITIPQACQSIGNWAFAECSSLSSVSFPRTCASIGEFVFSGCSSLASITVPIGWSAANCADYWLAGCDATLEEKASP